MSQDRKTQLLSSAEAAEQNFSTDNILDGGCVECGCEVFIRYHYDDDQPIANAPFVLTDSNGTSIEGQTDDGGCFKIENMGCGAFELLLDEGCDEFTPEELVANNPSLQSNPEYASVAGEYFALYSMLSRQGYLTYDADDSSETFVDVDNKGWFRSLRIPDEYEDAYDRFWDLNEQINDGSTELRVAVNNIHSSLAAEVAGQAQDNNAILLFCQIALGFVPVVGQAMDLYDLGDWGWKTFKGEELDTWHWAAGALIAVGFVPGLGDAVKKTGNAVIDGLRKADSAAIQGAIKIIRGLSNGNIVKYLSKFGSTLKEYAQKAVTLVDDIVRGLSKALSDGSSWIMKLLKDAFPGLIDAMTTLKTKISEMVSWIISKVDEFIGKVVTRITGTGKPKGSVIDSENFNAGADKHHQKQLADDRQNKRNAGDIERENKSNKCNGVGEPVDIATGKVFEQRQDFSLPGLLPLEHSRYYHSTGDREIGLLGSLWRSGWDISLVIDRGMVCFVDEDFSRGYFPLPISEEPTASGLKPEWRLYRVSHEYLLIHKNGHRLHFGHAMGNQLRLTKMSDAYGNAVEFLYERGTLKWVVLSDQNLIKVHSNQRRITKLELLDSRKEHVQVLASYQYDSRGYLLTVRASEGRNFDYQYTAEGWLSRWQDLSCTWVEHDYDTQGRAVATRCAGNYWHDQIRYDDEHLISFYKSAFGGITQYHRDDKNRIVAIVDPNGHITRQEWKLDNLVAVTNALGERTEYQYDDWGNVTQVMLADGTVHRYCYDEKGRLKSYIDPLSNCWGYIFSHTGSLLTVTDPESRQWQYQYNDLGQRVETKTPDGVTTRYVYNAQGLLAQIQPEGRTGFYFYYDSRYRLVKRVSDQQAKRRWFYHNQAIAPFKIEYEDGSHCLFEYDIEGNITAITDALGNVSRYKHGAFDKLSTATDPLGATVHYHYNREAEFAGVTNSKGHQWYYEFDHCGRISAESHYDGRKNRFDYDEIGRLVAQTKPDNHTLHYIYNVSGLLVQIQTTDPQNELTSQTWFEYDAAARLTCAENGDGWVSFEYNRAGQVVKETLNGQDICYDYDSAGEKIAREGCYTPLALQWHQGQLKQLCIGESHPLVMTRNAQGLETLRDNRQGFRLHHQWSQTGLLEQQQLGFLNEQSQDLSAKPHDRYLHRQYQYDVLDRLVGMNESYWGKTEIRLNPNGQISEVRQTKSWEKTASQIRLFGYDSELNLNKSNQIPATDNVIDLVQKREEKTTHRYDLAGRVVQRGPLTYRYDSCGRAVEKIYQRSGYRTLKTQFVWDEHDQLVRVALPNKEKWRYRYDPFGRRIAKECEQGKVAQFSWHYLWEGDTLVQQQQLCANGTLLSTTEWVYEPGSFRPLAQINTDHRQQSSILSYIITDHAGTPRELCNEQGTIIWRGQQEVWGECRQQYPSSVHKRFIEDSANDPIWCDLRYQGQIFDKETGLYYNRYRYYDADIGQYLSADPIGFAGGLRPQAYVFNPIEWVDPYGLMPLANPVNQGHHMVPHEVATHLGIIPFNSQTGVPAMYWNTSQWSGTEHSAMHGYNNIGSNTKPLVKPSAVDKVNLSGSEWMASLDAHYNNPELSSIRGDLHIIDASGNKGILIAQNVSPSEAWEYTKQWGLKKKCSR